MGEVVQFRPRHAEPVELAIDLPMTCGTMLGVHLTEWGDVAVFVRHRGDAVGGLLSLSQAVELRAALTDMLARELGPIGSGGAA